MNVLLSHSHQNSDDCFYTTFTRPATDSELKSRKGDSGLPTSLYFADASRKLVFIDNPILTDVTQEPHTNIKTILSQNPDVSSLSLILDDPANSELSNRVSIEDFIQPSQYVDIFDIQDFVSNAARSFSMLPANFRKQYDNDPAKLISALENNESQALASLQHFLGIDSSTQSAAASEAPLNSELNDSKDKNDKNKNESNIK